MSTLRMLYHSARADFLERTRRYGFLITIGLTIYVAYLYIPPASFGYLGFSLGGVRGIYNSAWIGGIITLLCVTLLVLPGFYLVKNSITRDIDTRVGEIIATTPSLQTRPWKMRTCFTFSRRAYLRVCSRAEAPCLLYACFISRPGPTSLSAPAAMAFSSPSA